MKGIAYETTHTAHLCLIHKEGLTHDEVGEADAELETYVNDTLGKYKPDNVNIDDGFCCNALTEIGLIGNHKGKVIEAAETIMRYVEDHQAFKVVYE